MATDWTLLCKKYKGRWVALVHDELTVLGVGKTLQDALRKAKQKTNETPILMQIPKDLTITFVF